MTKLVFDPAGPIEVPVSVRPGGKSISPDDIEAFWATPGGKKVADRSGCYVFARRAGKGYMPYYVGKATKTFRQEVFTDHKLRKYHEVLTEGRKGTPVLFFVLHPVQKGRDNTKAIGDLEKFLIQALVAANPDGHKNKQNTAPRPWSIRGVLGADRGRGKPRKDAVALRTCMSL